MSEGPERERIKGERLAAYADGELTGSAQEEMAAYVTSNPEAALYVREHQRVTAAARRVGRGGSAPANLRTKILAQRGAPSVAGSIGRGKWWRAAAAVLLVGLGLTAGRVVFGPGGIIGNPAQGSVVPAEVVAHASRVHAECSRLSDGLHSAAFPAAQGALAGSLEQDFHSAEPHPDLRAAGFEYVGAGPCGDPLPEAVHLLYRAREAGSRAAVSVFAEANRGQFGLQAGTLYTLSVATSPFPVVAWRTEGVVYFVVCDDAATEGRVLGILRGK